MASPIQQELCGAAMITQSTTVITRSAPQRGGSKLEVELMRLMSVRASGGIGRDAEPVGEFKTRAVQQAEARAEAQALAAFIRDIVHEMETGGRPTVGNSANEGRVAVLHASRPTAPESRRHPDGGQRPIWHRFLRS
jgi:hypothetical protein